MSDVVTATRQVLQDLLVPEMRELRARLDALEARMAERFDLAQRHTDGRFDEIRALIIQQIEVSGIRERLARVEALQQAAPPPQPAPASQPQAQAPQ